MGRLIHRHARNESDEAMLGGDIGQRPAAPPCPAPTPPTPLDAGVVGQAAEAVGPSRSPTALPIPIAAPVTRMHVPAICSSLADQRFPQRV